VGVETGAGVDVATSIVGEASTGTGVLAGNTLLAGATLAASNCRWMRLWRPTTRPIKTAPKAARMTVRRGISGGERSLR
jgi:hypothetical protein